MESNAKSIKIIIFPCSTLDLIRVRACWMGDTGVASILETHQSLLVAISRAALICAQLRWRYYKSKTPHLLVSLPPFLEEA